jgi:DNA-binding MarR family transcriptional regulator
MDFIRALGALVLDHRCKRLTETLLRTAEAVYEARGLRFRARWTSTYLLLLEEGPLPVTEIAARIGLTHPAVIGITNEMREAGLVANVRHRGDGRQRLIGLTPGATRQKQELERVWKALAAAQQRRFAAAGCKDIIAVLDAVDDGLAERSLATEVIQQLGTARPTSRRTAAVPALLMGLVFGLPATGLAQHPPPPPAPVSEVVRAVGQRLAQGYIDERLGRLMADSLEARLQRGGFDGLPPAALAESVTAVLGRLARDAHLGLHFRPSAPERAPAAVPQPDEPAGPGSAADLGFGRIEILPGGIGYIDLLGFSDEPEALAFADSMMAGMAGSKAMIIDLRRNRGGGPQMVRLLSTYFFDRPTHLVSTFIRGMAAPRERWTVEQVRGPRFSAVPVYLLTSRRTISAAESFAFGLRINRKVTIVGEPTAGGGHFGEFIELPGGFTMFLPVGRTFDPRTNQGWERTGLQPDVAVPAREALNKALELIRDSVTP